MLDTYQTQISQLSRSLSDGFIALATANFHAAEPGRGFGRYYYDGRMQAMRGVIIRENKEIEKVEWGCVVIPPAEDDEGVGAGSAGTAAAATTVRRRKPAAEDSIEEKDEKEKKNVDTAESHNTKGNSAVRDKRDPLRWFSILPPTSLRNAQSHFTAAYMSIPPLVTTLAHLRMLGMQLEELQFVYKVVTTGRGIFPVPLKDENGDEDEKEGSVHLCTRNQVVGVLERSFEAYERVWILKCPLGRVVRDLRWEPAGEVEEFPHLFRPLERADVDSWGNIVKDTESGWRKPFYEVIWEEMDNIVLPESIHLQE